MLYNSTSFANLFHGEEQKLGYAYDIECPWEPFRDCILRQWPRLDAREVEKAGPNRSYLSMMIGEHYGIDPRIIKNYLRNFERSFSAI